MSYDCFHLVLMVTHACNLRCDYCYTGRKLSRVMAPEIGRSAIERAVRSIRPGGCLELGFFGGEPLIEADFVSGLLAHARRAAETAGIVLLPSLTTNGTVVTSAAWDVMADDGVDLCISHDGLPEIHDRHRKTNGRGSAEEVLDTIGRLKENGREVRVATVVRPDTLAALADGIGWLCDCGIRQIDLTLDVWAAWDRGDMARLEDSLGRAADIWLEGLPDCAVNWFDEKAAHLMRIPIQSTARCGFGDGAIAVAPSGNLYPCERLIGEDGADHPLRLDGHALDGNDFCRTLAPARSAGACSACAIQSQCNTTCRCNNYVRTGDVTRPDALLCLLDKVCRRETARVLRKLPVACRTPCPS